MSKTKFAVSLYSLGTQWCFPMLIHGVDHGWQLLWVPSGLRFYFPWGFHGSMLPNTSPSRWSGGNRSQKRSCFSVTLASWEIWWTNDVKNLGGKFIFKVSKGLDCKNKGKILPKNADTVSLHLPSRCHSPAQKNHQKAPHRLCSVARAFNDLNFGWSSGVRTFGPRELINLHLLTTVDGIAS